MKTYRVIWEIDIEAKSPVDAARGALEVQRKGPDAPVRPDDAVVFIVDGKRIDLAEPTHGLVSAEREARA